MKLIKIREVMNLTGLSRMSIYRFEQRGAFPARRRIGANTVAWLDSDIDEWIRTRPLAQDRNRARTTRPLNLLDKRPPAQSANVLSRHR